MLSRKAKLCLLILLYLLALLVARTLTGEHPAAPQPGIPEIRISRAAGAITIDGDLSDPGWRGATRVDTWYEINPGDNVPPKVKSVGYLTYDEKFLYAGFEFFDPDPSKIRAPYGDRDNVPSYTDYGGIIVDTRNDGRTGLLLLANPRGIQYDAVSDDATQNEDSSLDLYWETAAKITKDGWVLEMRVPFSSLRYPKADPQVWRIMLYRNYPREFRYQMFTSTHPRGGNCFICRCGPLTGLEGLPSGGHLVVAPYATLKKEGVPRGELGSSFVNKPARGNAGADAKWTPNENTAIDATINPDFSQVESDVAQIGANERFALLFPEKRPFFLEGLELFSTPIQAVYTRSITSPRWGARATGKIGSNGYTVLVAEDRGGGRVILPGANSSDLADQDFSSFVAIGRLRRDVGTNRSFASFLVTDREVKGGGYNRVYGPDFQWRIGEHDTITGELLLSNTETPNRPDLTSAWNGQRVNSHAGDVWYSHSTRTWDWFTEYKDFGDGFRADDGFVPQVGYRENYGELGYTFRPTGLLSRLRTFLQTDYQADTDGRLILRSISPGAGMDGRWSSFMRYRVAWDRVRSGDRTFPRRQFIYTFQVSPSRSISLIALDGFLGEQVDFTNSRPGRGGNVNLTLTLRPTDHLELRFNGSRRWLNVDAGSLDSGRLFTASVARLRATYTFTARSFFRAIAQYVRTYGSRPVSPRFCGRPAGGLVHRFRALRLQAELAERSLRRLRGQPHAHRGEPLREGGLSAFPQSLLRVPEVVFRRGSGSPVGSSRAGPFERPADGPVGPGGRDLPIKRSVIAATARRTAGERARSRRSVRGSDGDCFRFGFFSRGRGAIPSFSKRRCRRLRARMRRTTRTAANPNPAAARPTAPVRAARENRVRAECRERERPAAARSISLRSTAPSFVSSRIRSS